LPAGDVSGACEVLVRPESVAIGVTGPANAAGAEVVRGASGHDQLVGLRLESGLVIGSRWLGYPPWHLGDRVHVWIEGPAEVLPRENGSGARVVVPVGVEPGLSRRFRSVD
jgi:hypothetical protein